MAHRERGVQRPVLHDKWDALIATAVIRSRERPWGALSVHSMTPRSFSGGDLKFMESLANVLALAIERNEHQLAERRERDTLQTIFDNSPVMISFLDDSGHVLRINPEWERTFGWTAEEASRPGILSEVYPDPLERQRVSEFLAHWDRRWHDFHARTRDGRVLERRPAFASCRRR